ncbi:MAG: VCBS repeat-containing protein, partial [Opitutales bacterium]
MPVSRVPAANELAPPIEIIPLAERTTMGSGKLFTLLDDEEIGVRYIHKPIPKKALEHYKYSSSLTHMEGVQGVCAGDFDGDGLPDLFYAYSYGGHRLYRNLGGFRFEDVTEKAGLIKIVAEHWAVGCSFVD